MLEIKKSQLCESNGVYSDIFLQEGEIIGIWASKFPIGRKLIQESMVEPWYESVVLGRYTNHSLTPNTFPKIEGDKIFLYSRGIEPGEEITADYTTLNELIGYSANVNF